MSTINAQVAGVWTEIPDDVKVATTAPTDGSTLWVNPAAAGPGAPVDKLGAVFNPSAFTEITGYTYTAPGFNARHTVETRNGKPALVIRTDAHTVTSPPNNGMMMYNLHAPIGMPVPDLTGAVGIDYEMDYTLVSGGNWSYKGFGPALPKPALLFQFAESGGVPNPRRNPFAQICVEPPVAGTHTLRYPVGNDYDAQNIPSNTPSNPLAVANAVYGGTTPELLVQLTVSANDGQAVPAQEIEINDIRIIIHYPPASGLSMLNYWDGAAYQPIP